MVSVGHILFFLEVSENVFEPEEFYSGRCHLMDELGGVEGDFNITEAVGAYFHRVIVEDNLVFARQIEAVVTRCFCDRHVPGIFDVFFCLRRNQRRQLGQAFGSKDVLESENLSAVFEKIVDIFSC